MLYYLPLTHFILTFGKLEQREQVTFSREQKRLDGVRRSSPSRLSRRFTANAQYTWRLVDWSSQPFVQETTARELRLNVLQASDAPTAILTL